MKRPFRILTFVLLLTFHSTAFSAPEPVRISLAPNTGDPVWVGQRVTVIVEVLSETFFSGPTILSLPDISGAVFYKPEERALVSSKNIDGNTYSVQRHELSFYPQRATDFEIPPFKVRFGVAGKPGEAVTEHTLNTKPLKISAKMPPGAEHLSVLISATDLKVTETWKPQPAGKVTVGDAFKRTIVFRASDMPGMVFPAIDFAKVEGLKLYQTRATVDDKIDRGNLVGERVDAVTYLCEKAGDYSLPAIAIPWWDLNSQKMQKIVLPAVSFRVSAGKVSAGLVEKSQSANSPFPWKWVTGLMAFLLFVAAVLFHFKNAMFEKIAVWQTRRRESENAYFEKIEEATSPAQTLNAITAWLARLNPDSEARTLHSFASGENDPELIEQFEALQLAVVSKNSQWDSGTLIKALQKTRQSTIHKRERIPALSSLNPE